MSELLLDFLKRLSKNILFQMPRTEKSSRKRGRPKVKSTKAGTRDICKCPVDACDVENRGDKVKDHQTEEVLWTQDGHPADREHQMYSSLDDSRKKHTDYFREHGFTKTKYPDLRIGFQ